MKRIYLLLLLAFLASEARSQTPLRTMNAAYGLSGTINPQRGGYWGVGVRLGDPSGLTFKNYLGDNRALEISFGRPTHWWYGHGYYNDQFYDYDDFDRNVHVITSYNHAYAIALQMHYLIHKDIAGVYGLQWYFGFGGQIRFKGYRYDYRYFVVTGPGNNGYWAYDNRRATDFDLGPDGVIGLEYTFEDVPISVFADATLFLEIVDDIYLFTQPAVGARYNF